ncbi:MAG: nucleoid occlusion factor SlmA, partial [Acidiferrobacterales bacterium]
SGERRQDILQTLVRMLMESQGEHITTAALARSVGVSEAALYRHFPSKAKMFEALIEFIEESLFSRINRILQEEPQAETRVQKILFLVLGFADRNPGLARLMYGDILVGETARLRQRMSQIYDRLETQLRQILREGDPAGLMASASDGARLLLAVVAGNIAQFVRSDFRNSPVEGWEQQWQLLREGGFGKTPGTAA